MAKAKAPAWLTMAFAEGVLELAPPRPAPAYKGALGRCWLAQHDERHRPCVGPFERFHFISRQRVENTLGALLRPPGPCEGDGTDEVPGGYGCGGRGWTYGRNGSHEPCDLCGGSGFVGFDPADLILLAAWDPRNGGVGCEGHHRRYDSHLTPELKISYAHVPDRVIEFAFDYGLEGLFEDRFGTALVPVDGPQPSSPSPHQRLTRTRTD